MVGWAGLVGFERGFGFGGAVVVCGAFVGGVSVVGAGFGSGVGAGFKTGFFGFFWKLEKCASNLFQNHEDDAVIFLDFVVREGLVVR